MKIEMKKIMILMGLSVIFISCNKQSIPEKETPSAEETLAVNKEVPTTAHKISVESSAPKKLNVSVRQSNAYAAESSYFLIEGVYAKNRTDFDLAEKFLSRAIVVDSLNDAAYYELADLYRTKEKFNTKAALENMQKASALQPDNTWYQGLLGQLYVDSGDAQEGIELFKNLVQENPKEIKYQYDLAYSYEQAKQFENAIDVYNDIETKYGFDAEVKHRKHQAYFALKDYDKGIQEIEDIVNHDETYTSYASFLTEYFYKKGDVKKSKLYLEKVFSQNATDARGNIIASQFAIIEEKPVALEKHLEHIFQNDELSNNQRVGLLVPLIDTSIAHPKTMDVIIGVLEKYSKQEKSSKLDTLLGDFYTNSGQKIKAIRSFRNATVSEEKVPFAVYRQLLLLESRTSDYENLEKDSKRALGAYPEEFLPRYFNGFSNYQLRRFAPAITQLEKASTFKDEKAYLLSDVLFYLGESYVELQQYEKGYQAFEKALEKTPNNDAVLNNYSFYLARNKHQLDRALELSRKAVELQKQSANMHDTYSYVLFQRGDYEEALVQGQIAFDLDTAKKASIAEHLGDCYSKVGKIDQALKYWKLAVERGGTSKTLKRKISNKRFYP